MTELLSRRVAHLLGVLVLVTGALVPLRVEAQSLQFGRLEGTVRSESRRPLDDAEVRVVDRSSGAARWTKTGLDGSFRFDALLGGRYDVFIEALGFTPVVHLDVRVGTAHTVQLDATVRSATPPVVRVDSVQRQGEVGDGGRWMVARGYGDLVGSRRVGGDIAAFSTSADGHSVEGLPWRMTGLLLDGAYAEGLSAPRGTGADAAALAMPVRGMSYAEVGGLGFDVEVGGTGLGLRSGTLRGGRATSVRALVEGGEAWQGGAYVGGGPLQGDTAQAIGGVDYQRSETAAWSLTPTDARRVTERFGAFGRLDWQANERLAISGRASAVRLSSTGPRDEAGLAALYGRDYQALNAHAALNIFGRLTSRISHEWRISTAAGEESGSANGESRVTDAVLGVGSGSVIGEPFNEVSASPRISGMLHLDAGPHRLKAGFVAAQQRYDLRFAPDADGNFAVGRPLTDPSPAGAWRRVEPSAYASEFRMRETGLFVQDAWQVADGLSVLLGLRVDRTRLPTGSIEPNQELAALSGLDNADIGASSSRASPRLGFRWELGNSREWVLEGGAGTYHALPDSRDIAEALTLDAGANVRYGVGALTLGAAPSLDEAPVVGRTVTLLAPDFVGPRTQRLTLGLTRRLGEWSASVSGVYRNTDFIARRRDLNLPASPVGWDQNGRPLQGVLRQEGEALVAEPMSNRRFAELDAVYALENTGYSEFWGATVGVERVLEQGVSFGLQYTFSQTRDNVIGFAGTRLSPFPAGLNGNEWETGRSDFDIPHRVLMTAEWRANDAFRLGLAYRLHSGLPFTPGVRGGVDANGDGDWRNDPAFVDAALPGMAALIADNTCLRTSSGAFASRNACRDELVHRLDVRAAIRLARSPIGRIELTLDALDLVAVNAAPVDHALVLVNAASAPVTDPATGFTTIDYVTNPNFGRHIGARTPGAFLRIGVRVTP